jgi:hypothetical protein
MAGSQVSEEGVRLNRSWLWLRSRFEDSVNQRVRAAESDLRGRVAIAFSAEAAGDDANFGAVVGGGDLASTAAAADHGDLAGSGDGEHRGRLVKHTRVQSLRKGSLHSSS